MPQLFRPTALFRTCLPSLEATTGTFCIPFVAFMGIFEGIFKAESASSAESAKRQVTLTHGR
jgi:hypothetical protein